MIPGQYEGAGTASVEHEDGGLRRFRGGFLTTKGERDDFDGATRRIARRIVDTSDPELATEPIDLERYVAGLVKEAQDGALLSDVHAEASGCFGFLFSLPAAFMDWFFGAVPPKYGPWSAACCIQVEKNDGMTWSAESVRRAFIKANRQFANHTFAIGAVVQPSEPPAIGELVGRGRLAWHATRRNLTDAFPLLRLFANPFAFLAVIIVAVGASMAAAWATKAGGPSAGLGPMIFAAVIGLIAPVILKSVVPELSIYSARERLRKLSPALAEIPEDDPRRQAFIDDLARDLAGLPFPRAVIVDRFEALDAVTRQAIVRYFEKYWTGGYGSEFWAVFDWPDGPTFAAIAKSHYGENGLTHFRVASQVLLDRQERLQLAREVEHPERAEFKTVKAIAHGEESVDENFVTAVREYRQHHATPDRGYDALDMLYVFGAAMSSAPFELDAAAALEAFRTTRDETKALLRHLLPGTKHNATEFGTAWASLHESFGPFLRANTDAAQPAEPPRQRPMWLSHERALWLLRHAHEIDAPEPKLVHAFWAAHFHATKQKAANEAFWVRKIAYHLTRSDASTIGTKAVTESISVYLLTASLWTLRQCLRLCIAAPVAELLQLAAALADDTKRAPRELVSLAWDAYDITADEDALAVALNAQRAAQDEEDANELGPLHQLFFDSSSLDADVRTRINASVFESAAAQGRRGSKRGREERLSDYAMARAAWLACTAVRIGTRTLSDPRSVFGRAAHEWYANAPGVAQRTLARLSSGHQATPEILDVATLSAALWTMALATSQEIAALSERHRIDPTLDVSQWELARFVAAMDIRGIAFADVLTVAETAVQLAQTLNQRFESAKTNRATPDLLGAAQAREIAFEALSALWIAHAFAWAASQEPPADEQQRAHALAARVEQELGVSVRSPTDMFLGSGEARANLVRGLAMCGALWRAMGIVHLDEMLSIRRVELMALTEDVLHEDELLTRMTSTISGTASRHSSTGVLANLTIASAVRSASELASAFVVEAAEIGVESSLAPPLRQALVAHVAIDGYNLDRRGDHLVLDEITSAASSSDSLAMLLARLPAHEVPGAVLSIVSASASTIAHQESTLRFIRGLMPLVADGTARETIRDIADFAEIRCRLQRGDAVDPDAVIQQWASRRSSFSYAGVLAELIRHGRVTPEVLEESGALLSRDPSSDVFNGWVLLAVQTGLHQWRAHTRDAVFRSSTSYLRASIDTWSDQQSIDWAIGAYRLLLADGGTGYEQKLEELENRKIHLYHARRVPHLLEHGLYFNIFVDYFDSMRDRGLSVTMGEATLALGRSASDDIARTRIREWFDHGAPMPSPLRGAMISSDFILLGEYIQRDLGLDETQIARAREAFNRLARRNLPALVESIVTLLPPSIAGVFQLHAAQVAAS